jgi:COP9 signalosome complex subunit 8
MPDNLLHHPLFQALTHLLASTFDRKYANIYSRAQALCILVQQPDFCDPTLAKVVTFMITAFLGMLDHDSTKPPLSSTITESFRQRTFGLLCKAFATIKVSQAQIYLGFTREQLLSGEHDAVCLWNMLNRQKVSSGYWQYDSVTDTFRPIDATGADSTKLTGLSPIVLRSHYNR